jgi:transketolase C-terminal domain/subunit/Zn-dependent alcohol dehydrogenase
MRNAFADELFKLASLNDKVFLLSGDIGNRLFDKYKESFGDRFKNCGVAEANLMGVASGLAMSGYRPIAYTITPFITTRCLEQIKIDVCHNEAPVIIVGVGAGYGYANLGPTHHSFEDIAILRSLPNIKIICPGDAYEVRAALKEALDHNGPVYIRIGKKNEPLIHSKIPDLTIGKGIVLKEGEDVCLLSTGNILPEVILASEKLKEQNISAKVVSMHTVKPLDVEMLREVFSNYDNVFAIEEHSRIGGFSSAIAEWIADNPQKAKLKRVGSSDKFMEMTGDQNYARNYFEIDSESIVKKVLETSKQNVREMNQDSSKTQAAILVKTGKPLKIEKLTLPILQPGQVLVDIVYSGICHTQLSECRGRRGDDNYLPHCLGHEGSGIVKEISEGVEKVKVGDKVIISWMKGTGMNIPGCKYPLNGIDVNAGAVTTFQKQSVVSENRLTKTKEGISMKQAALLGCAVATGLGSVFNVAKAKKGDSLAVFGTGGVGLCAITGAKIIGCYPIIAIDINDSKLLLAKEMGATHFVNPNRVDPVEEIKRITQNNLDFAVESIGIPAVMDQALQVVRNQGGSVVIIGNAPFGQTWNLNPQHLNLGKRVLGTWGGDNFPDDDFERYMDLVLSGELNLDLLTSKIYSLNQINSAIDDLENGLVARPLIDMSIE